MFVKQCILVLSVGLTATAGLEAATLRGLVGVSQTDSSGEVYTAFNSEPPDRADFVDSSDLTPFRPTVALTAPFFGEVVTDYAIYPIWFSGETSFRYPNDIAVAANIGGFSVGDGSSSKVYAIYGLDHPLARQKAMGESTGGGPGPGSDAPEAGTLLMACASCLTASALHMARKKALRG